MLHCGSILLLECFLGGNSLLLHYSRRAALPSEPRIFSAEYNTRFVQNCSSAMYSCTVVHLMSELHIFRVMSGSVTMLLSSRIQTALHRSVSRFPMKLPGTQIFRKCSSLHFQKINRCLKEFQEVATLESLADKGIQRRWLSETSTPSSTSTLSSNVTEVGSTYSPPPPPHPPPPLTAACPLMGTSISKLRRGSLIKAAHP